MFTRSVAIAVLGIALLAALYGHIRTVSNLKAEHKATLQSMEAMARAANEAYRAQEVEWKNRVAAASRQGQQEIDNAKADARAARNELDRLRGERTTRVASAKTAVAACPPGERQAATETLDLLSNLLAGAEDRESEIAEFADEAHARGLTCQRIYEIVAPN